MSHCLFDVVLSQFGEVETSRKVIAIAMQDNGLDVPRQRIKQRFKAEDGIVVECVAFLRTVEPDDENFAALFGVQRCRQRGQAAVAVGRFL